MKPINPLRLLPAIMMTLTAAFSGAQGLEAVRALEEWRWGVISYNDALTGKALLAMERAVSLDPGSMPMREWLGRAYWRSGLEDAALAEWDRIIAAGEASAALEARAERLRRRLSGDAEIPVEDEWIPLASFNGTDADRQLFKLPATVKPFGDGSGSLLAASYAGGDLLRLNVNGALMERYEGGLEGFDRPFDTLPIGNDRLLVSEFQADRLSIISLSGLNRGYRVDSWGESGRDMGQFLGPQFLALSEDGAYVYVSDWGNRRVAKWSLSGEHVLSLDAGSVFGGFEGPSGVVCTRGRVYVADSLRGTIDVFDPSGNYLGLLIDEGLDAPEGLSLYNGKLLVADGSRVLTVDLDSGALSVEVSLGEGAHRITTVGPDDNGNLALADFDADRIVLLTPLSTLYGGLEVTLERVRADAFPQMVVDVTVRDRRGQPIVGLDSSNFRIFDKSLPIGEPVMDWSSSEDSSISVAAVLDLSGSAENVMSLVEGVADLSSGMTVEDSLSLVGAGGDSVFYDVPAGGGLDAASGLIDQAVGGGPVMWDEALRLAASRLMPQRQRKAVVAFVNRLPSADAFDRYGLVETARMMANNGMEFHVVYTRAGVSSRELDYIVSETGGTSAFMYAPEGSRVVADRVRNSVVGRYSLTWESPGGAGFGRNFMPVAVEVIYISKSGRDESGSFAPLQ